MTENPKLLANPPIPKRMHHTSDGDIFGEGGWGWGFRSEFGAVPEVEKDKAQLAARQWDGS